MKLIDLKYALLLPLLLLLSSCQDYKGMKQRLVKGYQGIDAYCLFVGRIDFPYLSQPYGLGKEKEYEEYYDTQTYILNERLPVFEQVGLLNSVSAKGLDGQFYPLYNLTEEGKKYLRLSYNEANKTTYAQFCFGRREILEVTNMYDRETDLYGGKTTETVVDFTYNLYDMPEWASHPALREIKQYNIHFTGNQLNKKGQVYLTKKDGTYYNYSSGTVMEPNLIGYYL